MSCNTFSLFFIKTTVVIEIILFLKQCVTNLLYGPILIEKWRWYSLLLFLELFSSLNVYQTLTLLTPVSVFEWGAKGKGYSIVFIFVFLASCTCIFYKGRTKQFLEMYFLNLHILVCIYSIAARLCNHVMRLVRDILWIIKIKQHHLLYASIKCRLLRRAKLLNCQETTKTQIILVTLG